jgi:nucleotide-binding universal stress UspA family protein
MNDLKILVPISKCSPSEQALQQAIVLAKGRDAKITCLHVIEKPGFLSGLKHIRPEDHVRKKDIGVHISSKVHKIFARHRDIPFELIIGCGRVHDKVLEKAQELQVDLIVMGRSDSFDPNHYYLGSNTLRVISGSTIPVLSVRKSGSKSPRHMLFPLDLGNKISRQISKVIELSDLLKVRVTIAPIISPGYKKDLSTFRMRHDMVRKIFHDADINSNIIIIRTEDLLSEEILSLDRELGTDLIFLMNKEESSMSHSYFRSSTYTILRYSESLVLSINPYVFTERPLQAELSRKYRKSVRKVNIIDQDATA